jgi:hypothetical protein
MPCWLHAILETTKVSEARVKRLAVNEGWDGKSEGLMVKQVIGIVWNIYGEMPNLNLTREAKDKTPKEFSAHKLGKLHTGLVFTRAHVMPMIKGVVSNFNGYGEELITVVASYPVDKVKSKVKAKRIKVEAVTGMDFFTRLCRALPKEFKEAANPHYDAQSPIGYYSDMFYLECYKVTQPSTHEENYLFKVKDNPKDPKGALTNFFNDIRHVADKAGYEEVGDRSHMFQDSYMLIQELPNQFRVLVKH